MPPCCGAERKTAYCPLCGRRLAEPTPLDGLLAHCRAQARILEREVASYDGLASTAASARTLARDRARLARWRGWADGLAALLSNGILPCTPEAPTPPPPNDA